MLCKISHSKLCTSIILIQPLHLLRQGLHQFQIIPPAVEIITKINQHLTKAIKNPIDLYTMALDLQFKTTFWKNNKKIILDHYQMLVDGLQSFSTAAGDLK
ncbi:uncharacterized protein VP01_12798g1 [Puccinia sorghi]|uniref:Uncharacterized protein n=1 Tax=Puccinia sorghi TaxID=27349 RepID=A0A0L6VNU6_9BASI|nr:uncharacterized protein VP01_12798g1 [Puccinia sorghi]